jgi:hypothetical protein
VLTQTGRVQLLEAMPAEPVIAVPPALPGGSGPLWLFSNSTEKSQASQWVGKGLTEGLPCSVHPDAVPGLPDGAAVRLVSAHGSLAAVLRHDPKQRRDVAIVPKGGHFDRGQSANVLIAAQATDLGLGAAYLDCQVRIVPA